MKAERKLEQEIIKNLNQNISLEDISLNSSGSRAETDMLLMKLLNKYHLHHARKQSTSCQIHRLIEAA
jgi:hypothetical protein